jgi:hypothetical protein
MESIADNVLRGIDTILIVPFRFTGIPLVGFFMGTFCLAMACVVLGELVLSAAIRLNRGHLNALTDEIVRKEALSVQAYADGDRPTYKALNAQANDAWGRHFFTMAAYSAGMLWPVPFALAWMQLRFSEVQFLIAWPLSLVFGKTVGYPFIFILVYILCRIIFKRLRRWLPYFKNVQEMLDGSGNRAHPGEHAPETAYLPPAKQIRT